MGINQWLLQEDSQISSLEFKASVPSPTLTASDPLGYCGCPKVTHIVFIENSLSNFSLTNGLF